MGGEDEGKRRELERGREEEEEETYVLQFAAIKLCKFAVIRENLSIFAVIKKNFAAITPLGDFDMRPPIGKPASHLSDIVIIWLL